MAQAVETGLPRDQSGLEANLDLAGLVQRLDSLQ
jgi:hypothetical protein